MPAFSTGRMQVLFRGRLAWFNGAPLRRYVLGYKMPRGLNYLGAYCRKVARHSMKRSAKPSLPGQPPHTHVGLLKNAIFYAYDRERRCVVVGPLRIHRIAYAGVSVPHVLEYGGRSCVRGRWVRIAARPYMRPALAKTVENAPNLLKRIEE